MNEYEFNDGINMTTFKDLDGKENELRVVDSCGKRYILFPPTLSEYQDNNRFVLNVTQLFSQYSKMFEELVETFGKDVKINTSYILIEGDVVNNNLQVKSVKEVNNPVCKDMFNQLVTISSEDPVLMNFIKFEINKRVEEREKLLSLVPSKTQRESVDIPEFLKNMTPMKMTCDIRPTKSADEPLQLVNKKKQKGRALTIAGLICSIVAISVRIVYHAFVLLLIAPFQKNKK